MTDMGHKHCSYGFMQRSFNHSMPPCLRAQGVRMADGCIAESLS